MAEEAEKDVNQEVETNTTEQESSGAEQNDMGIQLIGNDNQDDASENPKEETDSDKTAEETKTEDTKEDAEPAHAKNAETRKQQLNNEIRDKIAERNALREEIKKLNEEKYNLPKATDLPTEEKLLDQVNPDTGDYYTRIEAKLAVLEAERNMDQEKQKMSEYTEKIVDNRISLAEQANRVLKDFPMFDEESDTYNKELSEKAETIVKNLLITDPVTNEIIGYNGSIYDVYSTLAHATEMAQVSGQIAGRKAVQKMMNSVDVVGGDNVETGKTEEDDPFLRGLHRID